MKLRKKVVIAGAGVVAAAGIGTAAFALFNTTASGSGTAVLNTQLQAVTLNGGVSNNRLTPGVENPVLVAATNPNGAIVRLGALSITNIHMTGGGANDTLCPVTVGTPDTGPHDVSAGAIGENIPTDLTLTLGDSQDDQTPCLTATLTFSVNAASPAP